MSLTVNTNLVNDTVGGYIVETKNVKAGENGGEAVMLDEYLAAAAGAIAGKEEKMAVSTAWPGGNTFLANGLYSLGAVAGEKTMAFQNGSGAEDMIYISMVAGSGLSISFSGSNHIGLEAVRITEGDLVELIGIWNPGIQKWSFAHRGTPA